MRKLSLLLAIALIAIFGVSIVRASSCCQYLYGCSTWNDADDPSCAESCGGSPEICGGSFAYHQICSGGDCVVPEFNSLGMGLAIVGAGMGFVLVRRKMKM